MLMKNLRKTLSGENFLLFVESGGAGRHNHYIKSGEVINIHNALVAYDKPTQGAINIFTENGALQINTPIDGNYMIMTTQENIDVAKDSTQTFNLRSLYTLGNFQFVVPQGPIKGKMVSSSGTKDDNLPDLLEVEIKSGDEKQECKSLRKTVCN